MYPQPLPRRRKTTGYVTACDVEAWRETKLPPSSRLPLFHEVPSGLPLCAAAGCEASRFIRRCIRCYIRRYIRRYSRRYTRCYIRRAATSDEKRKRKKKKVYDELCKAEIGFTSSKGPGGRQLHVTPPQEWCCFKHLLKKKETRGLWPTHHASWEEGRKKVMVLYGTGITDKE